ncbi:hypothetical protein PIB30_011986 [Stylosanthes scabra]|uniref:Mediator of RNA polymerase II transcription subunit 19b n=1 Tax=Stylosanthes scabra TaxID=79078 RepID=A0ABU6X7G9_9FABA|nr:hypothetical protein [Stylosanthes scabra]
MDLEGKRFGMGHKELGGARDLINHYKLWPYYEFFCKRSLPSSISDTHYLHNVVGDKKVKKGEGMELDQLCKDTNTSARKASLYPFQLDVLNEAFHMREMDPVRLSSSQKKLRTAEPKTEKQSEGNKMKKMEVKTVDRKSEKHSKHRVHEGKDGSCIENNKTMPQDSHLLQLKNQQDKKRRAETSNDPSVFKRPNTRK